MPSLNKIKSNCVEGYLIKFPNTPSLTLAKKIYKENLELFSNLDSVRCIIKRRRGAHGKKSTVDKKFHKKADGTCPFENIPEGLTSLDEWETVPIKENKTLILADAHIPYHDKKTLVTALQYGKKNKIDSILLLGDWFDFFSLSFFAKDPRKKDFKNERQIYKNIMDNIRQTMPNVKIRYKIGNHEERYWRYMAVKAPELIDEELFNINTLLCAKEFDLEIINDKRIIKIGRLNCVHGHEFGQSVFSPVNPARGLYLRGKENCIAGHWHNTSSHSERSMGGKATACWSIGCLCELHPEYLPINKWNHGFAVVDLLEGGNFHVENKTIIDGTIY